MTRFRCFRTAACSLAESSPTAHPDQWQHDVDRYRWTPTLATGPLYSFYGEVTFTEPQTADLTLHLTLIGQDYDEIPVNLRLYRVPAAPSTIGLAVEVNGQIVAFDRDADTAASRIRIGVATYQAPSPTYRTRIYAALYDDADHATLTDFSLALPDNLDPQWECQGLTVAANEGTIAVARIGRLYDPNAPCCETVPDNCRIAKAATAPVGLVYQWGYWRDYLPPTACDVTTNEYPFFLDLDFCPERCQTDGYYTLRISLTETGSDAALIWHNCLHSGGETIVSQAPLLTPTADDDGYYRFHIHIESYPEGLTPGIAVHVNDSCAYLALGTDGLAIFNAYINCLDAPQFRADHFDDADPRPDIPRLSTTQAIFMPTMTSDTTLSNLDVGCASLPRTAESHPMGCNGYTFGEITGTIAVTGRATLADFMTPEPNPQCIWGGFVRDRPLPAGGPGGLMWNWYEDIIDDPGELWNLLASRHPDNIDPYFFHACLAAKGTRNTVYPLDPAVIERFILAHFPRYDCGDQHIDSPWDLAWEWALYTAWQYLDADDPAHQRDPEITGQTWLVLRIRLFSSVYYDIMFATRAPYPILAPNPPTLRTPPVDSRTFTFTATDIISGWHPALADATAELTINHIA